MAATSAPSAPDTNDDDLQPQHTRHQQASALSFLALRFPAYQSDPTCHDAKSAGRFHRQQPRRGVSQVVTRAYHDILHTWSAVHGAFREPDACRPPHGDMRSQYSTFSHSDNADSDAMCGGCATSNASVFAAEIGDMMFEPYINGLLICVPIGVAAYLASAPSIVVFAVNALAIVPLSSLLTDATERVALEAGDAVGAFLNISLGNIVELILFFVTLINGHVRIVQASLLGSILVNLLPILGSALMATHATGGDDSLDNTETQILACLLFVSVFVFMIPTAFDFTFSDTRDIQDIVVSMSRVSSILILVMYTAYFLHTMQNSRSMSHDEEAEQRPPVTPPPLLRRTSPPLTPGPRTIRFADSPEDKPPSTLYPRRGFAVGPASVASSTDGPEDEEDEPRGRSLSGIHGPHSAYTVSSPLLLPPHMRRYQSRSISAGSSCSLRSRASARSVRLSFARAGLAQVLSNDRNANERNSEHDDTTDMPGRLGAILASATILIVASILLAVSARLLASTLDVVTHRRGMSEAVIGLIILPLASNLSSYLTVVAVATRDNLALAVAVSAGSAIQIALCVAPLTVLAGWTLGRPVMLALDVFEMAMVLGAVSLVNLLVLGGDGRGDKRRATGLKGGILCACFLVMGIATFFAPRNR